jgi:hypothetical protein
MPRVIRNSIVIVGRAAVTSTKMIAVTNVEMKTGTIIVEMVARMKSTVVVVTTKA